jgi:hypothetical protein
MGKARSPLIADPEAEDGTNLTSSVIHSLRSTRIEHEEDDLGLVDDFVRHADVGSISAAAPSSLLAAAECRRRVWRGRRADCASRAIEDGISSDT